MNHVLAILFTVLFTLYSPSAMARYTCAQVFEKAPVSQQIFANWRNLEDSLPPERMVSQNLWSQWGARDYLQFAGKLVGFETPASRNLKDWIVNQVLSFENLQKSERSAVMRIFSELNRREKEVELGVLIINKKEGAPEIHFIENNSKQSIPGKEAIRPLLRSGLKESEIESVQFFHNHPSRGPLSRADIEQVRGWWQLFAIDSPVKIPFHIYAVANFSGDLVIFHYGRR